jgi:dolichol-phosphate mannosyltransferase
MPDRARRSLAVVTPLANEADTVRDQVRRVLVHLEPQDRWYGITDGACRDGTDRILQDLAREDPRVVPIHAPENRCVVDAYVRGYREALDRGHDWILEMDGGLSHLPEQIPRFLEALEAGADFAPGSRFCPGGRYHGRWTRWVLSRGGTWLANALLGTRLHDMTSGFEGFTREALAYVVARGIRSRGHFFQTEIRAMLQAWDCREVPIDYAAPSQGVSSGTVLEAVRNLLWLRRALRASPSIRTVAPS